MRARLPDSEGSVERNGVRTHYEVFGDGRPTLLLLPSWSIVHSRIWKMQVPDLARRYRVITFDGRGNGKSDRPVGPEHYTAAEFGADALAVLDATGTRAAIVVSLSRGAMYSLHLNAICPDRVIAQIFISPATSLATGQPARRVHAARFDSPALDGEGWAKDNAAYWKRDFSGFVEFFLSQCLTEPHSTRPIEETTSWGLETTPETLADTRRAPAFEKGTNLAALVGQVRGKCLVVQGTEDAILGADAGARLVEMLGDRGQLVELVGSGHLPNVRDPVKINLLIRDFVDSLDLRGPAQPRRWARGRSRPRRALYLSSPIGLGHARRDVAIADELRKRHPDLQIDWLAQHPVTTLLAARGEHTHPASAALANESRHIETESGEHDLHAFQVWRRMDEILFSNFMVFRDLVAEEQYDLWIGDEAWELDYYLHENPEQKRAAYVWLTDFVGWLPMPDGGQSEACLTADYNAEMIEHIARYPRVRDRAIFIGAPDDIVPDTFGRDLPQIRAWTEQHYEFSGDYISGFDPAELGDRAQLRTELGYDEDEPLCLVSVGGSGVGAHLLRRIMEAYPCAREAVPGLRMVVVAGPRIDPTSLKAGPGIEVRAYVHDLYRHLAVCDVAVVQGGLTTTMELVALRRPFIYFPLGHHFEQTYHVPHRLNRYGAGRRMDYATATPEAIGVAISEEIRRPAKFRELDHSAVHRAAARISDLL